MFAGSAFGAALNDRAQIAAMGEALDAPPYVRPPTAPVLYVKSGHCIVGGGQRIVLPQGQAVVRAGATVCVQWTVCGPTAIRLALDLAVPHESYYRPAIAELAWDGSLPIAAAVPLPAAIGNLELVTSVNGAERHRWALSRLVRGIDRLIADVTDFMSPLPGDLLSVGVPFDAPLVEAGDTVHVEAEGLPPLDVILCREEGRA